MDSSEDHDVNLGESPDPSSHAVNIYDAEGEWVDEEEEEDGDDDVEEDDDEDDDDIDFNPVVEGGFAFIEDDVEAEFRAASDAEDEIHDEGNGLLEGDTVAGEHPATEPIPITPTQMMQILRAGPRLLFINHRGTEPRPLNAYEDNDEIEDGYGGPGPRRRRRPIGAIPQFPPIPSEEGRKLMDSGDFGEKKCLGEIPGKRTSQLARRLMLRELGTSIDPPERSNRLISEGLIPSGKADTIIHYNAPCYSGQFSADGNFFFSCARDFKVRMYDTSDPYKWKYYKTVIYPFGRWTITDASLSPDNRYLACSSIRNTVCLARTDPKESADPLLLDFSIMGNRSNGRGYSGGYSGFGIWSIRFSGDGREIVAGTSNHAVYVYDIESRQSVLRIPAHSDDVNAVCFGDAASPHIVYSGSDDTLIKVWDRRSMSDSRPAGVFVGHTEGLTYVDSKGDGRYVLSNGKDQMMKLWDLRKMMSTKDASKLDPGRYMTGFDYRSMTYSQSDYQPHPHDCSVVTFRGHRVLRTLIRCHFSPPDSTNSRYVYSGSEDGSVYIYNIDATLAGKINVKEATFESRPRELSGMQWYKPNRTNWKTCVRDASWHPNAPVIAATSWNGWEMSTGTCTIHGWNDGADDDEAEPQMGLRVNERLEYDKALYGSTDRNKPARLIRNRQSTATQRDNGEEV